MNNKYLYLLLSIGVITIYLLSSYQNSYAQTPTSTSQPIPTPTGSKGSLILPGPTLLLTPTLILTKASPPARSTPLPLSQATLTADFKVLTITLAELNYEDVIIEGPIGRAKFNLNLPSYGEILPDSSLTLHLIPNMELADTVEPIELEVKLNDVSIYQNVVTNFEEQYLNIPLPQVWPERKKGDFIEILLHIPGECAEDSFANLKISSDSFFTLNYRTTPPLFDLAYYPSPIYEPTVFTQSAYLVLPDKPTSLQLEGALALGARLGYLTDNRLIFTTTTASLLKPDDLPDEHLIIVGTPENNSLLSYLNSTLQLPASFQQRRLQLTMTGPEAIIPGTQQTYTLRITNNESISASNLSINMQLPYLVESVNCEPGCQRVNDTFSWNIDTLPAGGSLTITFSFVYPLSAIVEPISFSFELVRNQKIINVITLTSPVKSEGNPSITRTTSLSPFFFTLDGQAVPETDGIIQLLPSPRRFDKAILLVTGLTDEAVYKAGRALGTKPGLLGMKGQVALVQTIFEDRTFSLELPESFTLADLGYEDRVILGTTRQNISYGFELPLNWALTPQAATHLIFSHSSLLDPTLSSLSLFFNDAPIASIALDESNVMTGELKVLLPPENAIPGRSNNLVARIEMSLLNPCENIDSDHAWVNLKAASSLYLPHIISERPSQFDLEFLPIPFSRNSDLRDVIFALPESPSLTEYNAAMQIVSYFGAVSNGDSFQPVVLLGYPPHFDLSTSHLIVIGRPSRSGLLQEVNELLPQPFIPGRDTIQSQVDQVVFRLPNDLDLGYLQLIPSKWSQEHALLAFTGTSDLGLTWAAQVLTDPEKREQLKGNLALTRNNSEIYTLDTRELATGGEIAALVTAIPETVIMGTVTPTPLPLTTTATAESNLSVIMGTVTPTPLPPTPVLQLAENLVSSPAPELPEWFPYVIGGGIALIFIILGIAYWQSRRRERLTLH